MTRKRIVYTRPDGGVSIYQPAPEFVAWLSCGGYWRDKPRGWVDAWIARRTREGRREWAVASLARFAQLGGCTSAEAFAALRDFDCIHLGTGCEAWDATDLPQDRWFRNAWRRSHNGGPIAIDMTVAREIQLQRIGHAIDCENARRRAWATRKRPLRIAIGPIRDKIYNAESPTDLSRIWPEAVAMTWIGGGS